MASIRIARESDADEIAAIYRPWVERTAVSFELEPPSGSDMSQRIVTLGSHAPWLVCAGPEGVWGYAYASKHRDRAAYQWSVDVAVYVREDRRSRGVGRALYESLFALLRLQGFVAAHAGITQDLIPAKNLDIQFDVSVPSKVAEAVRHHCKVFIAFQPSFQLLR